MIDIESDIKPYHRKIKPGEIYICKKTGIEIENITGINIKIKITPTRLDNRKNSCSVGEEDEDLRK